jgi:hypothetical protein
MINTRINYIHENPVRTGLVARAEEYLYSSARNYAGLSSIIEIDMIQRSGKIYCYKQRTINPLVTNEGGE